MKRRTIIASSVATLALAVLVSGTPDNTVMSKDAGTMVVNTTTLTKNVRGYKGTTPVKIYIKKNKVVKVEALPNRESPKYFAMAKAVLEQFEGKSVTKASKMEVDGVTGATYTSKALVKNVQAGLDYYKEHK
jgi:electron transport complex protein RnfG